MVNASRSLSNALGVGFTRGISWILLGFTHRAQGRCSECFGINQQTLLWRGLFRTAPTHDTSAEMPSVYFRTGVTDVLARFGRQAPTHSKVPPHQTWVVASGASSAWGVMTVLHALQVNAVSSYEIATIHLAVLAEQFGVLKSWGSRLGSRRGVCSNRTENWDVYTEDLKTIVYIGVWAWH